MYIKLIDNYTQAKSLIQNGIYEDTNLASFLSYFALNTSSVGVIIYLFTVYLKIEGILTTQMNIISTPIYVTFGVMLFYTIFILPAMIKDKALWAIVLLFVFIFNGFGLFLMLSFTIDSNFQIKFIFSFIFVICPFTVLLIYSVCQFFITQHEIANKLAFLFLSVMLEIASMLLPLALDNMISVKIWIVLILPLFAYMVFLGEKIVSMFISNEEEDKDKFNGANPIV